MSDFNKDVIKADAITVDVCSFVHFASAAAAVGSSPLRLSFSSIHVHVHRQQIWKGPLMKFARHWLSSMCIFHIAELLIIAYDRYKN